MPYKFEYVREPMPREYDRRVKITDEKRVEIKARHANGEPQRSIYRNTGVSRRSVSFILFPERLALCKEQFKERRKDGRYQPEKTERAKIQRDHRQYKQKVLRTILPSISHEET